MSRFNDQMNCYSMLARVVMLLQLQKMCGLVGDF